MEHYFITEAEGNEKQVGLQYVSASTQKQLQSISTIKLVARRTFDSTSNTWYCQFLDECAGTVCINNDASCPEKRPDPDDDCNHEGKRCKYGQEECCGEVSHSVECSCFDGTTACLFTDFCLSSGIFGCRVVDSCPPTTAPRFETGTACKDGLNCKFGAEKCCGKTQPEIECNCLDEEFECRYVDRCRDIECA